MHWLRLFLFVIVPLLLALAAPALLLWAWGSNLALLPALLVGMLILAGALAIHLLGQLGHAQDADIDALWHEVENLRQQLRQAQLARQAGTAAAGPATSSAEAAVSAPAETAGTQPLAPMSSPPSATAATTSPTSPPAMPAGFQLYMEAVQELTTGQTRMYRALPSLPATEGNGIHLGRHAQLRARTLGQAMALQWYTLLGCLRFAEALQQRGCLLPIICPLDAAVLEQSGNGEALLALLQQSRWQSLAAQALLPAVAAEELADSGRTAHGALLALDAAVAGFVLQHGALPAADAPLPLPLTVRFFDIPAISLDETALAADVPAMIGRLRERGIDIIASGIDDVARLPHIRALAAFGRGRAIGVPRRVRLEETTSDTDGGETPSASSTTNSSDASRPDTGSATESAAENAPSGARRVLIGGR